MGGLKKYLPITYWTCLCGSLALIAFPGTSGFFSKDALIEAVHAAEIAGSSYAYWCVLISVFVTALYTFRMVFMVYHGRERMDEKTRSNLRESPWVITLPLILLAIPSLLLGWVAFDPLLLDNYLYCRSMMCWPVLLLSIVARCNSSFTVCNLLRHGWLWLAL